MKQRKLKKGGLIFLITILSMIPPLATDLYMPALPDMVTYFDTTTSMTSLTMTFFFIFMAIGTLVLGPVSDKYGRKPVLVWSTVATLLCSVICAFSPSITFLICIRAIQAFGSGGMIAIGSALVKDSFEGPEMGKVLSITQALMFIAPVLAPILGASILQVADWRMTFIALAALNAITLIFVLLLEETLPADKRIQESTLRSILGLTKVIRNPVFTFILVISGILTAPFMAYLVVAHRPEAVSQGAGDRLLRDDIGGHPPDHDRQAEPEPVPAQLHPVHRDVDLYPAAHRPSAAQCAEGQHRRRLSRHELRIHDPRQPGHVHRLAGMVQLYYRNCHDHLHVHRYIRGDLPCSWQAGRVQGT